MSLYAIGDLHLSFDENIEKPMDIFGPQWQDHASRVKENWKECIHSDDVVIIPGDISWGLKLEEAMADFQWIDELPGKKVIIKGNHDLWWTSLTKMNRLFESITFLQNTCFEGEDYILCGTRGWVCPEDREFSTHDQKIYDREIGRLKLSLNEAKKLQQKRVDETGIHKVLIGALHYPPTADKKGISGFTQLFSEYGVTKVVYGHLHGKDVFSRG